MRPTSFISTLRNILGPIVGNDTSEKSTDDLLFISIRRTLHLCHFNIVRSESLLSPPLEPFYAQVPQLHYPFIDLPVEKLNALTGILKRYLDGSFDYNESDVSVNFWAHVLDCLFPDISSFKVFLEYKLSNIENSYPGLKTDYCVCARSESSSGLSRCPLLFVELSREPLTDPSISHKDDVKTVFSMAASMVKLMSYTWGRGIEFMKNLRFYGILGGATDFDICCLFPVFPDNTLEEFYFVLSSSKKHLRFHVLESNSECSLFCSGAVDELSRSELNLVSAPRGQVRIDLVSDEISETGAPEAHYTFRYGIINSNALKVLEKVASLVILQAEMIGELDPSEFKDPELKYNASQSSLMTAGRSTHGRKTPKKELKRYRTDSSNNFSPNRSPSTRPRGGRARNLLLDLQSIEKENIDITPIDANRPSSESKSNEIEIFSIEKSLSDNEIRIYNHQIIKESPFFPKLFEWRLSNEYETIEFKFEQLEGLHVLETEPDFGLCKMVVDILGAIRTLHKAGYVHGDITPWNMGFSPVKNLWNLFDFNNSRFISSGLKGSHGSLGCYHGNEGFKSGRYTKLDDYIGFAKTMKYLMEDEDFDFSEDTVEKVFDVLDLLYQNSHSALQSLDNDEFFDELYCDSVQLLWGLKKNPNEESIKCAIGILESIQND